MRCTLGGLLLILLVSPIFAGAGDFFTENSKDFGPTPRGPILTHYFTLKNTTNQLVTIGQARVSCGCVSATVLKNQLKPGEVTVVQASMDSRRIPTTYQQKTVIIYVPFFAPVMEEVQLKVHAMARDDMVLTKDTLAFGAIRKGTPNTTTTTRLTIYNQPNFTIGEVTSTGGYIKGEAKQVAKGANDVTYEITSTLDETCPVGNWTAELYLKSPVSGLEKIRVPVTVQVTPPITVSPEALTLKELTVGESSQHRVMLTGTQAFKVLTVKGVDDVVVVNRDSDASRPVHILTIAVKPKVVGDISRLLEIETDNRDAQILKVPLTANVPNK